MYIFFEANTILVRILNVKPHKSAGPDGIHPAMINLLAPFLCEPTRALFEMTVTVKVPSKREEAEVVPIHKKGNFHSVANCRPVSITSVLC